MRGFTSLESRDVDKITEVREKFQAVLRVLGEKENVGS
jgi:hypothetical protein